MKKWQMNIVQRNYWQIEAETAEEAVRKFEEEFNAGCLVNENPDLEFVATEVE